MLLCYSRDTWPGYLRWNKHVRHVLVLAQQWKVEQNLQRLRVSRHDDELGDAAIQRLCCWAKT